MKAKLLSLNIDKSMSFSRFQARIDSSLKAYTGDNLAVEQYENIRDMFGALQDALENEELIIAAVDVISYLKFKNALIQAFGNEAVFDPTVLNKLEKIAEISDQARKAYAVFPESATVFTSVDGLYSGFGLENGSQCILCVPIDNNRIDVILRDGVIPFLSKSFGSVQNDTVDIQMQSANKQKVSDAVKKILNSNSVVAVNGTTNAETLKSCGDSVEGFSKAFVFTPHVEDKGNVNATEYAAQLAKVSLDLSAANIGACISDIYSTGDVKYLCIAVASDQSAIVRKLYMSENETESAFIESAAIELIELVSEKATGVRSVGIEIADAPMGENAITEKDKKTAGKKPLIILAILMSLIVIACTTICVLYFVQGEDGWVANLFKPKSDKEQTSLVGDENNFVIDDGTEDSAPVEVVKKLTISDYIITEYLTVTMQNPPATITIGTPPSIITVNGEYYDAKEAIARLISADIDVANYDPEAIKAHAVAIYSFLKFRNNGYVIDNVVISESYSDDVLVLVDSVFGEFVAIDNNVVITPFHVMSLGRTIDISSVLSYITSVKAPNNSPEATEQNSTVVKVTAEDVKKKILEYNSQVTLSDDPSTWLAIKTHDSAVSSSVGNVVEIVIGNKRCSGQEFRSLIIGADVLLSNCFTIEYNATEQVFEFTVYGQGSGVGMSLTGANYMAQNGSDYKTILTTYYVGTSIIKEG